MSVMCFGAVPCLLLWDEAACSCQFRASIIGLNHMSFSSGTLISLQYFVFTRYNAISKSQTDNSKATEALFIF